MAPDAHRRRRRLDRDLALALGSLLVFAALAEAGARLAGVRPERGVNPLFSWTGQQGDVWRFDPGSRWSTRVGGHPVAINRQGFRDRDFESKARGVFRILVLGDSVSFGHGQPESAGFVRRLEGRLRERGFAVEVLNAGIPGWSTYQQRRFYESDGEALAPDLVLVAFVLNDVTEIQRGRIELDLEQGLRLVRWLNWLAERSAAVAGLKGAYAAAFAPHDRQVDEIIHLARRSDAPQVRRAMQQTETELARLFEIADARDVDLGLVLLPFRFQLVDVSLDAPQRRLVAFARGAGVATLDTRSALGAHGADAVLMDADHLTPLGHRIVAEEIAAWLERESLLPAPGPSA